MKFIRNLLEYYDELFGFSPEQKVFYNEFVKGTSCPVHFLGIGCGTGLLESTLAKKGSDVTGIENCEELLRLAVSRRRTQLMSLRFFKMEAWEMTHFLAKGFYDVISVLNGRIMFIGGKDEIKKFFIDSKKLLAPGGTLVIQSVNFEERKEEELIQLPEKQSLRVRLFSEITGSSNRKTISVNLENGSGRVLPILSGESIYPLLPQEIEDFAEEAGFESAEFYSDYKKTPFTGKEEDFVVLLR